MTVNVPLLRKTLEHITEHPDEWNQALWGVRSACGTAYCLAGHALAMSGATFTWDTSREFLAHADIVELADEQDPEIAGALALGLDPADAATLFDGDNQLRDLYGISSRLTDGEIPIPDVLPDGS